MAVAAGAAGAGGGAAALRPFRGARPADGAVRVYESLLEQAGFQVLNDESRLLEEWNVQVVGYDDVLMGWTDPELYQLNRDIFQLVVAHEPSVAEKISAPGECFVLSGHTHGGRRRCRF